MFFPALREAIKDIRAGFGSEPITLDLKADAASTAWYRDNGYYKLYSLSGGGTSWSGESVNLDAAQNHSVVWACERIISESVAFMPLDMMHEKGGSKDKAKSHPCYTALHNAPNDEMTSMSFRETLTGHLVMGGNSYAQIFRRSGTGEARELYPLLPGNVTPDRDKRGRLVYRVDNGGGEGKTFTVQPGKAHDILHIPGLSYDGIRGYSVITIARQSIGTALSANKYAAKFYANGGRLPYHLEHPARFKTDQDFDAFKKRWSDLYGGDNYHVAPILEQGMKWVQDGLAAEDAQFLQFIQAQAPEICRWFLISPHLVGDLSRATFSNIEHLALQFVKMTLTAWITRWEQNLWRCVLTPEEKQQGYYFKHNVNGLLRGDFQSRMSGYATLLQNGIANIDEVRDLEDWNPLPGDAGKGHHIQLNMQTIPGTGEPTVAEQAAQADSQTAKNLIASGSACEVEHLSQEMERVKQEIRDLRERRA